MQAAFNDHQTGDNGNGENDFEFGIDMNDLNDGIGNDSEEELVLGDLKNFFNSKFLGSAAVTSSIRSVSTLTFSGAK